MIKNILKYSVGLLATYLILLLGLSNVYIGDYSLLQYAIDDRVQPYYYGHALQRFREVDNYKDVDILFIGSSHCYQSFDPAVFARLGGTTFNLGSNSQAPVNTYYILKEYWEQLNPKLVIFELYPNVIELDGLEGYFELLPNKRLSWETVGMTVAVKHPHAINAFVSRLINAPFRPVEKAVQRSLTSQEYRAGGYVYSKIIYPGDQFGDKQAVNLSEKQIEYVHEIISFIKEHGADVILVSAPLPVERVAAITNYKETTALFGSIAAEHDIAYYDFNQTIDLPTSENFRDHHHLNANGAKVFSYALVDTLLAVHTTLENYDIDPIHASDLISGRAIAAMSGGQNEAAANDFTLALELNSNNSKALFNRGLLEINNGQFEKALNDFVRLQLIDPTDMRVIYNRGVALQRLGRLAEAESEFNKVIESEPSFSEAFYSLAQTLESGGRISEAIKMYEYFISRADKRLQQLIEPVKAHIKELRR